MPISIGMPFRPTNGIERRLSPYIGRRCGFGQSRISAIHCAPPSPPLIEGIEVMRRGGGGGRFERADAGVVIGVDAGGGFGVVVVGGERGDAFGAARGAFAVGGGGVGGLGGGAAVEGRVCRWGGVVAVVLHGHVLDVFWASHQSHAVLVGCWFLLIAEIPMSVIFIFDVVKINILISHR